MLVGILSDTHGFLHPRLAHYLADVDLILHAGDIGTPDVLDALEAIGPTRAVWGNIDGSPLRRRVPEEQRLDVDGLDVRMRHIGGHPGRWAPGVGPALRTDTPGLFVCGHSHILRIERVPALGGMLYLNPGACGRQGFHRVKTLVRLVVERGAPTRADVVHLED